MKKTLLNLFTLLALVSLSNNVNAQRIAAGANFTHSVCSDSTIWGWGGGVLGDGSGLSGTTPRKVANLTSVVAIFEGYVHTIALTRDSSVWVWGSNTYGELGTGSFAGQTTPVKLTTLGRVISASGGYSHTLAVKKDGTVWACGDNTFGQLGDGTTNGSNIPKQVQGLSGVIAVSAGYNFSLVVKSDGTVWGWGLNNYGQLGDGTTVSQSSPVQAIGLTGITKVSVSSLNLFSVALKNDSTVWTWGYNANGELGNGTTVNNITPAMVSGLSKITAIATGDYHTITLRSDGKIWAWGGNPSGQVGDGTQVQKTAPVTLSNINSVVEVGAGGNHSVALKSDGTVWTWGEGFDGQLGYAGGNQWLSPKKNPSLTCQPVATRISELSTQNSAYIYPNPSTGIFTIKNDNISSPINFEVYNLLGEKILQKQYSTEIDLSNALKGIYFVKIAVGTKNYTEKIVVQ